MGRKYSRTVIFIVADMPSIRPCRYELFNDIDVTIWIPQGK